MIAMLAKIAVIDTAGQGFEIEKTFNEFENFRVKFAEKFSQVMKSAPEIHNTMVKNGLSAGILCRPDNGVGYCLGSHTPLLFQVLSAGSLIESKSIIGVYYAGSQPELLGSPPVPPDAAANPLVSAPGAPGTAPIQENLILGTLLYGRVGTFGYETTHPLGGLVGLDLYLGSKELSSIAGGLGII
jgi:hypothetical protein